MRADVRLCEVTLCLEMLMRIELAARVVSDGAKLRLSMTLSDRPEAEEPLSDEKVVDMPTASPNGGPVMIHVESLLLQLVYAFSGELVTQADLTANRVKASAVEGHEAGAKIGVQLLGANLSVSVNPGVGMHVPLGGVWNKLAHEAVTMLHDAMAASGRFGFSQSMRSSHEMSFSAHIL